ncbi:MAG: phosphoglucosamine mutase, partial [Firmicutes bacterium]|nr:phosphoglucosamine mutase [Bacillota bacterium]
GEQSGHIIFLNHTTTGDGTLSSLQFMKAVLASGKKPSELSAEIEIFPQVLVNAKVDNDNKKIYMKDEEVKNAIDAIEAEMAGSGRVLIRPSGTEPLVRVMIEGNDIEKIHVLAQQLADLIESKFA